VRFNYIDPWEYVWSLNGERRDLTDDQRYLCWKRIDENKSAWQAEQDRIREEANRKRSEAAKERERDEYGTFEPSTNTSSVNTGLNETVIEKHEDPNQGQITRAELSKTNRGAVARGDWLTKNAPEMIEPVIEGKIPMAQAIRQIRI
jgi:hypothetical protein